MRPMALRPVASPWLPLPPGVMSASAAQSMSSPLVGGASNPGRSGHATPYVQSFYEETFRAAALAQSRLQERYSLTYSMG